MFSVKYFANELCQENDPFAEPVLCCTVHTQKETFDAGFIYQNNALGSYHHSSGRCLAVIRDLK